MPLIGLLLVLVGQGLLYTTNDQSETAMPPIIWVSALGALIFGAGLLFKKKRWLEFKLSPRILWIAVAIAFSILTAYSMLWFRQGARTNYIPVLTFWFFSMVSLLAAFAPHLPKGREVQAWIHAHRYELLAIAAIAFIGFAVRFYGLGEIPQVVNGDEGLVGLNAQETALPRLANPFALWENFGALYLQTINFALNLFGVSAFSLRLMAAIGGTLAVPALYLLARQVAGKRVALIASTFLALSHTHIHFSRTAAVAYVQGTWLIPLELFFFLRGLQLRRSWMMVVSAILLSVHFIVYLDSQIILVALIAFSTAASIFLSSWVRARWQQLATFFASFAIFILPEFTYVWRSPNQFFDRVNALGSFQSGWITDRLAETGYPMTQVLFERVAHAFLSLIFYPAFDFYGSPVPVLSLVAGSLFLLGLVIALAKTRSPQFLLTNGYFWTGTLAVGLFAIPPSADSYRMLMVLPAAFIFAALGLDQALGALQLSWLKTRLAYTGAVSLVLLSIAVFNIWAYFGQFAGQCLYGRDSSPARFASYLGNYLGALEPHVAGKLLSDETYFYGSHSSVNFLSGHHPIENVYEPVDTLQPQSYGAIIASPDRIGELRTWAEDNPGGVLTYQYDCGSPILLGYEFK